MKKNKLINKVGVICSITQIIISVICLAYNIVIGDNYWIWIIMLCGGICLLSSNISLNKKTKK